MTMMPRTDRPPSWDQPAGSGRQDLLGLALELHMYCTGSGPDMAPELVRHAIRYIRFRLGDWSNNGEASAVFDTAVKLALHAVLQECRERSAFDLVLRSALEVNP